MMALPSEIILRRCPAQGVDQYQQAIQRWCKYPHYVNRRISATVPLYSVEVQNPENGRELLKRIIQCEMSSDMEVTNIINSLKCAGVLIKNEDSSSETKCSLLMEIKKLLPRYNKVYKEVLQITIIDTIQNEFIFIGLPYGKGVTSGTLSPVHPFSLQFVNDEMLLMIFGVTDVSNDRSVTWLKDRLFPKLQHWIEENQTQSSVGIQSLSLIPADQYTLLYQRLKEKYGRKLVEIWPERTDPLKFVYEDVAIASYLLLLWKAQRIQGSCPERLQSFVDLGCGNGLLVYILNSEGHPGFGVDVRKRGIWDLYPSSTQLKVQTFVPSNCNIFPEADCIIGNHSDELTPWIPVIAARSSYKCSFFLLPCCAYVFSGRKYQRQDSSRSQYAEYLDYIKSICENCGFKTNVDRLKIPSTKRICLVSSGRDYSENNLEEKQKEIMEYVQKCTEASVELNEVNSCPQSSFDTSASDSWTPHFKARDPKEEVRNCTQLHKDVIDNIIENVVKVLLAEKHNISVKDDKGEEKLWNAGSCVKLGEIATALPQKLLTELKNEHGGLQTLLKNNRTIFSVANGSVKLTMPVTVDVKMSRVKNVKREFKFKQRNCWFFNFHPDGCPLKDEECCFRH